MSKQTSGIMALFIAILLFCVLILSAFPSESAGEFEVTIVEMASVNSAEEQGNGSFFHPFPSQDGRYVTYMSWEMGWYPEDNGDNYCRPSYNCHDVYIRDRVLGETRKITQVSGNRPGNDHSFDPQVSADGRWVLWNSFAFNLVPNDTNGSDPIFADDGLDVFLYDWETGGRRRVSKRSTGEQIEGNSYGILSADGRYSVFFSDGPNIVPNYDPVDTELYIHDLHQGLIEHVPLAAAGQDLNGKLWGTGVSTDLRHIVFASTATNIIPGTISRENVYILDRTTGVISLVSHNMAGGFANQNSGAPRLSPDGSYVVFASEATDLVPNDNNGIIDIFAYEVATGNVRRVNLAYDGAEANGGSYDPSICDEGHYVAYASDANNLVAGDNNGIRDGFVYDLVNDRVAVLSRGANGEWGNGMTHKTNLAGDCGTVFFTTDSNNIFPGDLNGERDIYVAELPPVIQPADFSSSNLRVFGDVAAGSTLQVAMQVVNSGGENGSASWFFTLPANTTIEASSLPSNLVLNGSSVSWSGMVSAESQTTLAFDLTLDPTLTGSVVIPITTQLTANGTVTSHTDSLILNPIGYAYLPIVRLDP